MNEYEMYNRLISNIYALLDIHGKSVSELETVLRVSHGYLSKLRLNYRNIELYTVIQVADFFGVTLDELVYKDFVSECIEKWMHAIQKEAEKYYVCVKPEKK